MHCRKEVLTVCQSDQSNSHIIFSSINYVFEGVALSLITQVATAKIYL